MPARALPAPEHPAPLPRGPVRTPSARRPPPDRRASPSNPPPHRRRTGREDAHRLGDETVPHGVVDRQRDVRRRRVADLLDVEVQVIDADTGPTSTSSAVPRTLSTGPNRPPSFSPRRPAGQASGLTSLAALTGSLIVLGWFESRSPLEETKMRPGVAISAFMAASILALDLVRSPAASAKQSTDPGAPVGECSALVTVTRGGKVCCTNPAGHDPAADLHQGVLRVTLPDGREHAASLVWSTASSLGRTRSSGGRHDEPPTAAAGPAPR
jgi:hypothetical protein